MTRSTTLNSSYYHSEDIFKSEIKNIFTKEWLWVGRSDELITSGDYITREIFGYPIIILKDESESLKAYHNVCRHRAAKLLSPAKGNCKQLVCPYHGWKYGLSGILMDTPKFFTEDAFDESKHSLFNIKTDEMFGLIFINLDKDSQTLLNWFGNFKEIIDNNLSIDLIHHNELKFDVHANWKTYIDNYQEGYHIPLVHPQLNRDVIWEDYTLENKHNYSIHSVPERGNSQQPGNFGWHFPNFIFNTYGRGIVFQRIEPIKAKWCRVVYNLFRPSKVSYDDFESKEGKYQVEVSVEDQKLIPEIQQNLQAGIYNKGPLNKRYETGVAFFHDLVLEKINLENKK